jgi:hypothetical protein
MAGTLLLDTVMCISNAQVRSIEVATIAAMTRIDLKPFLITTSLQFLCVVFLCLAAFTLQFAV